MAVYFANEMAFLKEQVDDRGLKITAPTNRFFGGYEPGTPRTHGSSPDRVPQLTLVQIVYGKAGKIEVEMEVEIKPTDRGLDGKINEQFWQLGYAMLSDELFGPPKLVSPTMTVTFRTTDNMKAISFWLNPENRNGKVTSGYTAVNGTNYKKTVQLFLDYVQGVQQLP